MKAVIGAVEPVHGPIRSDFPEGRVHQIATTQGVTSAAQTERGHFDGRKVRVAKLIGTPGGVQRIREQEEPIAGEAFGSEHG